MKFVKLVHSENPSKKYDIYLMDGDKEHKVTFGSAGYSDFTKHHEEARKQLYLGRHRAREDWTESGLLTPGFWARWILWNLPTVSASLADARRRFHLG